MIHRLRRAPAGQNLAIQTSIGLVAVWTLLAAPASLMISAAELGPAHLLLPFALASLLVIGVVAYGPVQNSWRHLRWANAVTFLRALLTCLLASVLVAPALPTTLAWTVFTIAAIILVLDGVDGWLARRLGEQSSFGARFDMETDAFLIVVLSLLLLGSGKAGPWVVLSGLLRYLFLAAGQIWPWLRRPLPPRRRRQAACAFQTAVLVACLSPAVSAEIATVLALLGLGSLALSFTIDVAWLRAQARTGDSR